LLQQIGVPFRVIGSSVDETAWPGEAPRAYVARLAAAKAEAGWLARPLAGASSGVEAPVLAADTAVILDDRILGKPRDRVDAVAMLLNL
jgi:septum formation protein